MSRAALLDRLRSRIGLDPQSLGDVVIDHAFADARRAFQVHSDAELEARLEAEPGLFAEVAEYFVVPETWFFRAPEQFDDLARFAQGPARTRRPLRVLCLPCATGEEVWSAAITLFNAGLGVDEIDVLGIDVAHRFVEHAERGVYRMSALRGQALPTWTTPCAGGFSIDARLRSAARFRVGNALDAQLFGPGERFDAVFCRNLLIYLDAAARQQVLATLIAAVDPPGLFLSGQAEVLSTMAAGFVPLTDGSPLSFRHEARTLREAQMWREPAAAAGPAPAAAGGPVAPKSARPQPLPAGPVSAAAAPSAAPSAAVVDPLRRARALADSGDLEQARQLCLERLQRQAADVEARCLLGVIEAARDQIDAAEAAFAQVLYLDRDNLEALQHRIALATRRGAVELADQLRARVRRLRSRATERQS